MAMADASHYDLILLDLNLPKADGLTVTGRLRRQSRDHQPLILILTARGEKADQLAGLAYGADDDVIKPLNAEILPMRIRALLRRREKATVLEGYRWGDLQISSEQMQASYQQQPLQLTPKEILILEALIRANGQACSKASLIDAGWHLEEAPSEENIRTHLKNLRMKLNRAGAPSDIIETVYGVGLRMNQAYR